MKTKMFLVAALTAFTFAVSSCGGNKKAADATEAAADSCCATKCEQVCDSTKHECKKDSLACCADSTKCEQKADCDKKEACEKKECEKK